MAPPGRQQECRMAARHGTALSYPSELAAGCPLHAAGEDTVRHSSGTPSFVSDEPTHCVNLMRSGGVHSNARGTCRGPWICGWIELIFNVWATSIGNRPFPCSHSLTSRSPSPRLHRGGRRSERPASRLAHGVWMRTPTQDPELALP